jgi:hypothetical protein
MALESPIPSSTKRWMAITLLLAAIYYVGLSIFLFFSNEIFLSILLLLIGLGCGLTAIQPRRFWSILLLTSLFEFIVLGSLMWTVLYKMTTVPYAMWILISGSSLILWWAILKDLYNNYTQEDASFGFQSLKEALDRVYIPARKTSLGQLSYQTPLLVIFLRYLGCTFCRQTLANIEKKKKELQHQGLQIVLIHMNTQEQAKELFESYGLEHFIHISDPHRHLYRLFGLRRVSFSELVNPVTCRQFFNSTILEGHRQGRLNGDPMQMPGVFVVYQNEIVYTYYPKYISDQPNFSEITNLNDVNTILNSLEPVS